MKKAMVVGLLLVVLTGPVRADEQKCGNPGSLTDPVTINECIETYNKTLDAISKANTNNANELNRLNTQINNLKKNIASLDTQLVKLGQEIFDKEVKMGVRKEVFFERVRQDYIRKREEPLLTVVFSSDNARSLLRNLSYRELIARQDLEIIDSVGKEVEALESQKAKLKSQNQNLKLLTEKINKQAGFLAQEVEKANKYVSDLSGKISALNARQQALVAERAGTSVTSVGEVPLADDPNSRLDYNPGFSPAFAVFSFGAPHFRGMSQYGAYGRSKAGQNVEQILKAYYGNGIEIKKDYSTGINIRVQNHGTVDIETYTKRIYEMPTSWGDNGGMEALKAQAVAARSYALAYTNNGSGSICATESCQVYKPANKGGKWEEAVNATRGWVLVAGGKPFSAWYASTSGGYQEAYTYNGYTTPGFWDTTSDWTRWADGAWEVKGGSPWFFKGWYKSRSNKACGRNHPWLNQGEFADMVNAAIVYAGGGDVSGMFPEDVRSCIGGNDNPWSKERMAQEANKHGGAVSQISGVRVEHGSNGVTTSVVLQTNRGEVRIDGQKFQRALNLRLPGQMSVKSGLFSVEKK